VNCQRLSHKVCYQSDAFVGYLKFIYLVSTHVPELPSPTSVEDFLKQLKVECYFDVFVRNGFDELDTIEYLTEKALSDMKVAIGHQGKILRKAREIVSSNIK
jgi:hypothetical protein